MNFSTKSIIAGLSILVSLLIIVGIISATAIGYVYVGVKSPSDKVSIYKAPVCESGDISKYNDFVIQLPADEALVASKRSAMEDFLKTLEGKSGFVSDATCQFIAYSVKMNSKEYTEAQEHLTILKSLASEGIYPSVNLLDLNGVESLQDKLDAYSSAGEGENNPLGKG